MIILGAPVFIFVQLTSMISVPHIVSFLTAFAFLQRRCVSER